MRGKGTCKIGYYCTSTIEVSKYVDLFEVKFYPYHFGHTVEDSDVKYMNLSNKDEKHLANQILLGIPYDKIIENIEENSNSDERISKVDVNDLRNISNRYMLKKHVNHSDDNVSVRIFVEQLKESKELVYYKDLGKIDENFPNIKEDSFILCFMFNKQKSNLRKHQDDNLSETKICTDATHGICQYEGFKLNALMYITDLDTGMPFAFIVSNSLTEEVFRACVRSIKNSFGLIYAHTFMTDDDPIYEKVWKEEMDFPMLETHFVNCDWHSGKTFVKNSRKIKNKDLEIYALNTLKSLMDITDVEIFENGCQIYKLTLRGFQQYEGVNDFLKYFETYLEPKKKRWAKCYRPEVSLHSNGFMEAFHQTFKSKFLRGKKNKRLDIALGSLRDIMIHLQRKRRLAIDNGQTNPSGRKDAIQLHKFGIQLEVHQKEQSAWIVTESSKKVFEVITLKPYSEVCMLHRNKCPECRICICHYSCECPKNQTHKTCRHVHSVANYRFEKDGKRPKENKNLDENEIQMLTFEKEIDSNNDKEDQIRTIYDKWEEIRLSFDSIESNELKEISKMLSKITYVAKLYRTNVKGAPSLIVDKQTLKEPPNKNSVRQPRFVKKKRKKGPFKSLTKPDKKLCILPKMPVAEMPTTTI
ncbi:unnamed protein product [Meganyctiphanes norvegica]|uniref:MULE transposase domain-containing protein n=1 Tax=Meganyctiphanes norvegica TaxID=48144 RepID=A0AAV2QCN9_MEGNR